MQGFLQHLPKVKIGGFDWFEGSGDEAGEDTCLLGRARDIDWGWYEVCRIVRPKMRWQLLDAGA